MQNFFIGEGNLGNNPTLKYVPLKNGTEQKPVLSFDAKFNVQRLNKSTGAYEDTGGFWATVEFWGKRAELYNKILKQGCRVIVAGEKSQDSFIATKGERVGQSITTNTITASFLGLSLLGVESVVFEPRKAKVGNMATGEIAQTSDAYQYANEAIPMDAYGDEAASQ